MSTPQVKNNLGQFYTNLGKSANETATNIKNSLTNISKNTVKSMNSLFPLTATNTLKTGVTNNNGAAPLSSLNSASKNALNVSEPNSFMWPILIFVIIVSITLYLLIKYKQQISAGIHNIIQKIRGLMNQQTTTLTDTSVPPVTNVTDKPVSPQQDQLYATLTKPNSTAHIINKLLPLNNTQVFNVSKNDFTYYDAEPLCRALGAELATYDQVKDAWSKGADWCNYGWVKGQAAVYPTQEETWNKIQSGPEEDRGSCGTPGLNGGYFENPEMKFGVNCIGPKPAQSEHDQEVLMRQGQIPMTVPGLAVDKKVQEFKKIADNLGVLPFNEQKWSD